MRLKSVRCHRDVEGSNVCHRACSLRVICLSFQQSHVVVSMGVRSVPCHDTRVYRQGMCVARRCTGVSRGGTLWCIKHMWPERQS